MQTTSLTDLSDSQLTAARASSSGRSAVTIFGGHEHDLRQTLIALAAGHTLGEHESPGDANLQVLVGTVRRDHQVVAGAALPRLVARREPHRHGLHADTDAVVLLTVATRS